MPNYDIDKDAVKAGVDVEKEAELAKSAGVYDEMETSVKDAFDKQEAAIDNAQKEQTKVQNAMTDFAIDEIEQNKEYARKDYLKEQSGAYKDWQKQSNAYGVNAEQQAAQGLKNTGFSESSQVAMYNQYQNRVATARESFVRAVQDYDNDMTQARLQNSSILAEIAVNALKEKAALAVQEVAQLQQIWGAKESARQTIEQNYYQRYLAELDNLYKENSLKESARQFDEQMAWEREKWNAANSGGSGGGSGGSSGGSSSGGGTINKDSGGGSGGGGAITGGSNGSGNSGGGSPKEPTPNMSSVSDLGYGPINAQTLNELVESGAVIEYEKDGQLYYKRAFAKGTSNSSSSSKSSNKTIFDKIGDKFTEWFK